MVFKKNTDGNETITEHEESQDSSDPKTTQRLKAFQVTVKIFSNGLKTHQTNPHTFLPLLSSTCPHSMH